MKKKIKFDKNYIFIFLFGILMLYLVVPENYIFGSTVDWANQHTIFPDYFRKLFYETGNLFPNFAFSIGAGQNIYNFSYYGLLSPYTLLSYFFPWISMKNYIIILNSLLYCLIGILTYRFLKPKFTKTVSFTTTIILMCAAPILFQLHRHFMFVNYLPFVLIGLIGVDHYFETGKKAVISISVFLTIMTSYYYSIMSIATLCIYALYCYLKKVDKVKIKEMLKEALHFLIPIGVGILMSGILLLPTMYVLKTGRVETNSNFTFLEYMIPYFNTNGIVYDNYGIGLTALAVVGLFVTLLSQKKEEKYLAIVSIILVTVPAIIYLLNGNLYYRGKVLIPTIPLYGIILGNLLEGILKKKITIKKIIIASSIGMIASFLCSYREFIFYAEIILIPFLIFLFYHNNTNQKMLLITLLIPSFITLYTSNHNEDYVFNKEYEEKKVEQQIKKVLKKEPEKVRFNHLENTLSNVNEIYITDYNQNSLYSSVSNNLYKDFYTKIFKNPLSYRNNLILAQNNDILFQIFMGIKYIYTKENVPAGYEKMEENIYKNENVLPMFYGTSELTNEKLFDQLSYPYSIGTLLNSAVVNSSSTKDVTNSMKEIDFDFEVKEFKNIELTREDDYTKVKSKKAGELKLGLNKPLDKDILIIQFRLKETPNCKKNGKEGDAKITINEVTNVLTCKQWMYKNNNKQFNYVLSSNKELKEISIEFAEGLYKIEDFKIYELAYHDLTKIKQNLSEFHQDKEVSNGDNIEGIINMREDGYFITSLPYDPGFQVYVDDKKQKKEIVNKAFLGFQLEKGYHQIKIKYHSPLSKEGKIMSILGMFLFLIELILDRKKQEK